MGADGTVCVGPRSHRGGLISRRSELRDLRKQISELEENLDSRAAVVERLEGEVADAVARLEVAADTKQNFQRQADEGSPVVLMRGAKLRPAEQGSAALLRDRDKDMFR